MDGQETINQGQDTDAGTIHSDQSAAGSTFLSRIGRWFKREHGGNDLPLMREVGHDVHSGTLMEPRGTFLRPWARRDQAIANLQEGFNALTDLMRGIRDNLEEQNRRQDQLLDHLANLPEALQSIPEGHRVQSETLKAINQQIGQQTVQQTRLAELLDRISQGDREQRKVIDDLHERVETINEHDQVISSNLTSIGSVMEGFSRNSETSAKVLEQLRDNISSRDAELERVLHRQGNRFTTLLAIAIFLSIAALAAVGVIGYLGYEALNRMK